MTTKPYELRMTIPFVDVERVIATPMWVRDVLGRDLRMPSVPIGSIHGPVLITGGEGSIGAAVHDVLTQHGIESIALDVDRLDVTDSVQTHGVVRDVYPGTILHLAGAKHAPDGELDPMVCVRVNTLGTANVLDAAASIGGVRVVTASTCKACDPETAYGASKLLAERLTLNAGQRVARFHNVIESSGNVFRIWRDQLMRDEPITVDPDTTRYYVALAEAVALVLHAAAEERPGRFILRNPSQRATAELAALLHPGAKWERLRRRGDRRVEPYVAASERVPHGPGVHVACVTSPHDPTVEATL